MKKSWEDEFRSRMHDFRKKTGNGDAALSIKVRVTSGCFHREHSPAAYKIIDDFLDKSASSKTITFKFIEHESGPEILVYLALTTAGLSLTKSIIDLIVAIIKARSDGIKKGDVAKDPIELIIRRVSNGGEYKEEIVLKIGHDEAIKRKNIINTLKKSINNLFL